MELGLSEWLAGNCAEMGIKRPSAVQRNCIPPILAGKDVLGTAETGSGKTAAFALPILQALAEDPYGPRPRDFSPLLPALRGDDVYAQESLRKRRGWALGGPNAECE